MPLQNCLVPSCCQCCLGHLSIWLCFALRGTRNLFPRKLSDLLAPWKGWNRSASALENRLAYWPSSDARNILQVAKPEKVRISPRLIWRRDGRAARGGILLERIYHRSLRCRTKWRLGRGGRPGVMRMEAMLSIFRAESGRLGSGFIERRCSQRRTNTSKQCPTILWNGCTSGRFQWAWESSKARRRHIRCFIKEMTATLCFRRCSPGIHTMLLEFLKRSLIIAFS